MLLNFTKLLTSLAPLGLLGLLTACTSMPSQFASQTANPIQEAAPTTMDCPSDLPTGAKCLKGKDDAGAPYVIVAPPKWSGVLVVHAHGGPSLGAPTEARGLEDLNRWSIIVREGHAYAASVFRQGGFAVSTAAEDSERVRQIFNSHVGKPRRTILHGQSWGAMVATRAAELYPKSWDAMLLTSGVVAGPATYDFRLDLRALYQHLCQNHPRPNEPQYNLALGLPAGNGMKNADLSARVNECLALNKPAAERSPEQRQKAKLIVDVIRTPESSLMSHLNWGTFTLADIARRHGGAVLSNQGVKYSGSSDDVALNAALDQGLRFGAEAKARAQFVADVDHQGRFPFPVLSANGIHDATVFVEGSDTLKARMQAAGNGERLVQTFVDSGEHSYLGDAIYPPLFASLLRWVEEGVKPTKAGITTLCSVMQVSKNKTASECRYLPDYEAKPLANRIPVR